MSKTFTQLKKRWNLPEDTSVENLLRFAQKKLADNPDDPETMYALAECQRHLGQTSEANNSYKKAIKITDKRTQKRGDKLEKRVKKIRNQTRIKLVLLTLLPLVSILLITGILWNTLNKTEPLPADADPKKFAFTQWLAKQQMVQIMTTLQKQNPELTFSFNQSSVNQQTPMEFMQSLMKPDALGKLRRDQQKAANKQNGDKSGRPAFQCSKEPIIHCAAKDIPSAAGERRKEVILLMEAYQSVLDNESDCDKLEKSITSIGDQLQWRKSERRIKANLEHLATECFYRKKNIEKTIEHARKLQCTGDDGYVNSVYWFMTAIQHHAENKDQAFTSYQCFQEATDYISKNGFSPATVASRHRESGALAWLYFDDLETATSELIKARTLLKSISKKSPLVLEVISEINLDLLETYVTANIDLDTFQDLLEEINSSGLLTDGYKQIKDALVAIYFMQNNKNEEALAPLHNLSSRFKLMPEYICGWDWSGFKRGLSESISDDEIRKQAISLVEISNCYTPKTMNQRISDIAKVVQWLKGN